MSKPWQNFVVCLSLHIALPLLPLALELWFSGHVQSRSAVLTAALYAMAIGLSSRHVAMFGVCILTSFFFSAAFGFLSINTELEAAKTFAYAAIVFVASLHMIERFHRHVRDRDAFFEFSI